MRKYSIQIAALIVTMYIMILISNSCQKLDYGNQTKSKIEKISQIDSTSVRIDAYIFDLSSNEHPDYGICFSNSNYKPTISDNKVSLGAVFSKTHFSVNIENLLPNENYIFRVYVLDEDQPVYSLEPQNSIVTDIDGNEYNTITIGTQTWMKENLKTTKYKYNTAIAYPGTDDAAWQTNTTGAYAWYNNDIANKATYGAIYNWHAVNTGKLCPTGWHVPTDAEWTTLTTFLGGESEAGGKLKEAGFEHWQSPNTGATNSSGFTALPGGVRNADGTFDNIGYYGFWWGSAGYDAPNAWGRGLNVGFSDVFGVDAIKSFGFSVRCLKDN